jgi:hypothetical protein
MNELVRSILESRGWGARNGRVPHDPPELRDDYAARVVALLVERLGGRVDLGSDELLEVPDRLMLIPYSVEPDDMEPPGLALEIRPLQRS